MPARRRTAIAATVAAVLTAGAVVTAAGPAHAAGAVLRQLTGHPDGSQVFQGAYDVAITPDDRYVAFTSAERYLPTVDDDVTADVYLIDRTTGEYRVASLDLHGHNLGGDVGSSIGLTADGSTVVFDSGERYDGSTPTPDDEYISVWVKDVTSGFVSRVSRGEPGWVSTAARLTPSGRYLSYLTGPIGGPAELRRHDRSGDTEVALAEDVTSSSISDDGSEVAYVAGGRAFLATVAADGSFTTTPLDAVGDGETQQVAVSPDGTKVLLQSTATNLAPGVPLIAGTGPFAYLVDVGTMAVTIGAARSDGLPAGHVQLGTYGNAGAQQVFTADSRAFTFTSDNALTTIDTTGHEDVFVRELSTGRTTRVSVRDDGTEMPPSGPFGPGPHGSIISPDGSTVIFFFEGPLYEVDRSHEADAAPVASIAVETTSGTAPLDEGFSPAGSSDPDVKVDFDHIREYRWDFDGDGVVDLVTHSPGEAPRHTYAAGSYTPTLTVVDSYGLTNTASTGPIVVSPAAPTYDEKVLGDHPTAYFRLGEASGTVAHDSSPTALDGTFVPTVTLGQRGAIPTSPDTAAGFDGRRSAVRIGDRDLVDASAWTIELWARTSAADTSSWLYDESTGKTAKAALRLDPKTGTRPSVTVKDDAGKAVSITGSRSIVDGSWHHLVVVRSGRTVSLYIDGRLDAAKTAKVLGAATSDGSVIGAQRTTSGTSASFGGSIDEAALYPVALSPETIADHYATGVAGGGGGGTA